MLSDERVAYYCTAWAGVTSREMAKKLMRQVAAEATAAFKARVRAQAIGWDVGSDVDGESTSMCALCGGVWATNEAESHEEVRAQPCAAEVEP
jgi:hypothetical protein